MWMCSNFLPNKLHPFPLLTLFFATKQKSKANVLHIHWIHCWFVLKWLQCVWFFVFYPIFTHTHTHTHLLKKYEIEMNEWWREFVQVSESVYIIQCIWGRRHCASSREFNETNWLSVSLPFYCFFCIHLSLCRCYTFKWCVRILFWCARRIFSVW